MRPAERERRGPAAKGARPARDARPARPGKGAQLARGGGGKLATGVGLKLFLAAALASGGAALMAAQLLGAFADEAKASQALLAAAGAALAGGLLVGVIATAIAGRVAARVTEIGLAVTRLGRTAADVRVRISGNDEVTALGRAVQYLATDLAELARQGEKGQATLAATDPSVRAMRDRVLPQGFAPVEGFELDGAVANGTRGGLDYFEAVPRAGGAVLFVVSAEGASASALVAVRAAREQLLRALQDGADARGALGATNRALHDQLARGVCAKASVVEFGADEARLFQAGYRAPLLVCRAGRVEALAADGIALGLDDGPVFEKSLRPAVIPLGQGTRLVQTNEAGMRLTGLTELVQAHSPKHTTPFMNLVLGQVEADAGKEGLREDLVLLTVKRW
jgi:hypothetical protein